MMNGLSSWLTVAVCVALAGWFSLTLFNQFPAFRRRFSRFTLARLIPVWTFFAPRPGIHDYDLLIRHRLADHSITPWRELDHSCSSWKFLWNPEKRALKALLDACSLLAPDGTRRLSAQLVQFSAPYLFLLHIAVVDGRTVGAHSTQFMVKTASCADHGNTRTVAIALTSLWHKLPDFMCAQIAPMEPAV